MNLSTPSLRIFIYFICFWLCCVFIAVHRLSLAAVSWGYSLFVGTSLVALWCVESSQTKDQTCVPCIGK